MSEITSNVPILNRIVRKFIVFQIYLIEYHWVYGFWTYYINKANYIYF